MASELVLARAIAARFGVPMELAEAAAENCIAELGPAATVAQALALLDEQAANAEES